MKDNIIQTIKYGVEHGSADHIDILHKERGGINLFESLYIYCNIIEKRPRNIIEFSPNIGHSTIAIGLAAKHIGAQSFATFEINFTLKDILLNKLNKYGLNDIINVYWGDAKSLVPQYIKNGLLGLVDFLFIDSLHSEDFANSYVSNVFPLLSDNCTIGVHDIGFYQGQRFKETINEDPGNHGEYKAIKRYIEGFNKEYVLLHEVAGGQMESSYSLPINESFYNEIAKIVGKDFFDKETIPRSIWFQK